MRSLRPLWAGLWLSLLAASPFSARAAPADGLALENRLEEQWRDGDRDLEDLAAMRLSRGEVGGGRAPSAYVALEGFSIRRTARNRELGALLVLQFPFERVGQRRAPRVAPHPDASAEAARSPTSGRGFVLAADTSPPPSPVPLPPASHGGAVVVDLNVTRACVAAALRVLGLADDARIDGIAARSRSSGLLPELRLRAMRSVDESGRITLSEIDPSRYTETGGATDWIEARLTFRLDRLLFADDEVAVERIRIERSEQRSRAAARVIEALFEWQRAYLLAHDPDLGTDDHIAALLRELEAAARLDVMTDGWFGRYRAGLKVLPSG